MRYIPIENSRQYVSGIYCIESDCGKKYIGSAIKLKMRCDTHRWQLIRNSHDNKRLQNYVNKYGINSLSFYTLELCEKENLIEREQFYFDTIKPFFNILKIAGNTTGNKPWQGRRHSEETKAKIKAGIAIAFAGKPKKTKPVKLTREENIKRFISLSTSEAGRKRISEYQKGNTHWLGKKHKPETIANRIGAKNPNSRKVYCAELDKTFDTLKEANEFFGVGRTNVCVSIARGGKVKGKYTMSYAD